MTTLYNCKSEGYQFRITKFDTDMNVESSYLLTSATCECPAGHRPSCRHRDMLHKFLNREAVDTDWFLDFDRGGWVQQAIDLPTQSGQSIAEPSTIEINPFANEPPAEPEAVRDHPVRHLSDGITIINMEQASMDEIYNTIAEAVGKPTLPTKPKGIILRRR